MRSTALRRATWAASSPRTARRKSWRRCARCSRTTRSSRATRSRCKTTAVRKTLRYSAGFFFVHFLLLVAALVVPLAAFGAEDVYLAQLIARARELRLAERPEWRKLLHYEPDLIGGGLHGLLDNRDFYNSAQGKTRPQTELQATLARFLFDAGGTPER